MISKTMPVIYQQLYWDMHMHQLIYNNNYSFGIKGSWVSWPDIADSLGIHSGQSCSAESQVIQFLTAIHFFIPLATCC